MILKGELHVEELEQGIDGVWRRQVDAKAAVATSFGVGNVLVADPPVVEAKVDAHGSHRQVCEERDHGNVEQLLGMIGIGRHESIRVLGEVMGAMKLPQAWDVVHGTMVPVEPEVEDDGINGCFEQQPCPPLWVCHSIKRSEVGIV